MQALAGRRPSVGNKRRSSYAAGFEAQAGAGVAPSAADAIERRPVSPLLASSQISLFLTRRR